MNKRRETKPTTTRLVLDALIRSDDFRSMPQLCAETGRTANQVSAALCWLRKSQAVDSVVSEEKLWWMATPGDDKRETTVDEITVEPIRKTRRKGVIKKAP